MLHFPTLFTRGVSVGIPRDPNPFPSATSPTNAQDINRAGATTIRSLDNSMLGLRAGVLGARATVWRAEPMLGCRIPAGGRLAPSLLAERCWDPLRRVAELALGPVHAIDDLLVVDLTVAPVDGSTSFTNISTTWGALILRESTGGATGPRLRIVKCANARSRVVALSTEEPQQRIAVVAPACRGRGSLGVLINRGESGLGHPGVRLLAGKVAHPCSFHRTSVGSLPAGLFLALAIRG